MKKEDAIELHTFEPAYLELMDPRAILAEKNMAILKTFALHPSASNDVLLLLSNHSSWDVRSAVARNSRTSAEILDQLSHDKFEPVLCSVASNPNTPSETLARMLSRYVGNDNIRKALLANGNTPLEAVVEYLLSRHTTADKIAIGSNPSFMRLLNCAARFDGKGKPISDDFDQDLD